MYACYIMFDLEMYIFSEATMLVYIATMAKSCYRLCLWNIWQAMAPCPMAPGTKGGAVVFEEVAQQPNAQVFTIRFDNGKLSFFFHSVHLLKQTNKTMLLFLTLLDCT